MNEPTPWATPTPLRPDVTNLLPFPVNALPPILRNMASAIATTTSTDPAIAGNFHCFGCGVHGDVIKFTQMLFDMPKPIDAVKKLNEDFGLHIDIGQVPTKAEVSEYQKRIAERKAYEEWEKSAWKILHDYFWLMREWREFVPKSHNEKCDKRFVYSLHHIDYAEYLCEEFIQSDKQGRIAMQNNISAAAEFLSRQAH